jgi:RNA-binding protein Musashi
MVRARQIATRSRSGTDLRPESLKNYFSQFGEVVECTVMRDGATGRSRGFGFLTFRDPKVVNTVMVKEHTLDGKLV